MNNFELSASFDPDSGSIRGFHLHGQFESDEMRDAAIARFPKYCRIKPYILVTDGARLASAGCRIDLTPSNVTGALNETGVKRVRKIVAEIGNEIKWHAPYSNSYQTMDEALAAIQHTA